MLDHEISKEEYFGSDQMNFSFAQSYYCLYRQWKGMSKIILKIMEKHRLVRAVAAKLSTVAGRREELPQ